MGFAPHLRLLRSAGNGAVLAPLAATLREGSKVPNMFAKVCPFCGIATDVPHETQEGCIAALHGEIARMREILHHVKSAGPLSGEPMEDRETA